MRRFRIVDQDCLVEKELVAPPMNGVNNVRYGKKQLPAKPSKVIKKEQMTSPAYMSPQLNGFGDLNTDNYFDFQAFN